MFTRLTLKHFRAFGNLDVKRLAPINLFTGKNNSGKTSFLEGVFLLSGAGNPQLSINTNVVRGIDSAQAHTVGETLWKPLFNEFDMEKPLSVSGMHSSLGPMNLRISSEQADNFQLSLKDSKPSSPSGNGGSEALLFSFRLGTAQPVDTRINLTSTGFQIAEANRSVPFQAIILTSRIGNNQEDAIRLGQLRKRKQGDLVLDALRIVEPSLLSVEDNVASGTPMIWGDIGLPELVPLPVMGEGMSRIARVILAIASVPGGIVLIDEFENGIHHSALGELWRAVFEAATQFNVQVFATTHSFECACAAQASLNEDSILLHRLERGKDIARCVTYSSEEFDNAVAHNLEVR